MSTFVEALRTAYKRGSKVITLDKLKAFLAEGKITQEEYDYIVA